MIRVNDIGSKVEFQIRANEIDPYKKLKIVSLIQMMQEASLQNAIQLKVSVWDLEDEALSWVLIKKNIRIFRLPLLGERIKVLTYPSGTDKIYAYRDFKVFDNENKIIAQASTSWILINTKSRALVRSNKTKLTIPTPQDIDLLQKPANRVPPVTNCNYSKQFTINWNDLDWNKHVNNVFLIKCFLDGLPNAKLNQGIIHKMNIHFKAEGFWNDELTVQYQEPINKSYTLHSITRPIDNKLIAVAQIFWK